MQMKEPEEYKKKSPFFFCIPTTYSYICKQHRQQKK